MWPLTRAEEAVKLAIGELELAEGVIHNDLAPVLAAALGDWLRDHQSAVSRQVQIQSLRSVDARVRPGFR